MVLAVLGGNSVLGLIFGWLYACRGLTAAIVAHIATDVVLHVLPSISS